MRRLVWTVAVITLTLWSAGGIAAAQGDAARVMRAVKGWVAATGEQLIAVGSWVGSGASYKPGESDHDLRLVLPNGTKPAEAAAKWRTAREGLATALRNEFGRERANAILARTNLYPPAQLMTGVADPEDALRVFRQAGQVPNLGYTGPLDKYLKPGDIEGLYGTGSQAFTQFYEEQKGRLIYKSGNSAVAGATDLTHFNEGRSVFTVSGTANTAQQWGDHILEELGKGDARTVQKQLGRLAQDLTKSRELAGMSGATALRSEIQNLQALLKQDPESLARLGGTIRSLVARGQAEARVLKAMGESGPMRQGLYRIVLDSMNAPGELGLLMKKAYAPLADAGITLDHYVKFLVLCAGAQAVSGAYAKSTAEAFKVAGLEASLYLLLPAGLMAQITDGILEEAKANGFIFAANFQEAWDLMAGVYTAWGRAGTDPDLRRKFTLDDLVRNYQSEAKLKSLIYSQATRASCRNLGGIGDDIDRSVADAIYAQCMPVILQAWRWRRDELFAEYTNLGRELQHAPLLIFYTPCPASTEKGPVTITARVRSLAPGLGDKLARMDEILKLLCGKRAVVHGDYEWTPEGEDTGESTISRKFTFASPGVYPVKVHLRVWPVAPGVDPSSRLLLRRDVWAGVDVEVTGQPASGFWVLDRVEIRKQFQSHSGAGPSSSPQNGVTQTYSYQAQASDTSGKATLSMETIRPRDEGSGDEMLPRSEKWSRTVSFSWTAPPRVLGNGDKLNLNIGVKRGPCSYQASVMTRPQRYMQQHITEPSGEVLLGVWCALPWKTSSGWAANTYAGSTTDQEGQKTLQATLPKLVFGSETLEIMFQLDDKDARGYWGGGMPNVAEVIYIYKRGSAGK